MIVFFCLGCYGGGAQYAFYKLPSVTEAATPGETKETGRWIVGLGPLEIPDYLNRAAIVTRVSDTRLAVNDGHRWAGSLQDDILRVLASHLDQHHKVKEVVVFPWPPKMEPDVQFKVEIKAFEGGLGQQVTLKAVWSATTFKPNQPAVRRVCLVHEKISGNGIEDLVAAMGSALSGLGQDMADAVDRKAP
jgi:uncharacterized lipoprotein YmbA